MRRLFSFVALALTAAGIGTAAPASASNKEVPNDMSKCRKGGGPAMLVVVEGVKVSSGKIRVQSYRATSSDWLAKGRWLTRTETPARAGTMTFCVPLPAAGSYGIAVRHDVNANGRTDIMSDGGGMSNNPRINILNLGKPSYTKVAVPVGEGELTSIFIGMRYM